METRSTISDTDIKLFRRLMNQEGLVLGDKDMNEAFDRIRHNHGPHIEVLEDSPTPKAKSVREPEPSRKPDPSPEDEEVPVEIEDDVPEGDDHHEEKEYASTPRSGLFADSMRASKPPSPRSFEERAPSAPPRPDEWGDSIDGRAENDNATIRHQKQEILYLLRKRYPKEADSWNMSMPLVELKYEYNRREEAAAEETHLQFAKMAMLMIMKWLEGLNRKHGHRLELDGWSASMSEDMSRFDHSLGRLYSMWFRKKSLHPLIELLLLFVASAFFFHAKSKQQNAANGPNSKEAFFNQVHDIKPPPTSVPFDRPGNQNNMLSSLLHLFGSKS
jgi:hypothetical protein